MMTQWHPTREATKREAEKLGLKNCKIERVEVTLGEPGFPKTWWRAEDKNARPAWRKPNKQDEVE